MIKSLYDPITKISKGNDITFKYNAFIDRGNISNKDAVRLNTILGNKSINKNLFLLTTSVQWVINPKFLKYMLTF